jgi:hypothetical protein
LWRLVVFSVRQEVNSVVPKRGDRSGRYGKSVYRPTISVQYSLVVVVVVVVVVVIAAEMWTQRCLPGTSGRVRDC